MSDIFEEVEESLSKDRWTELWKKYGIFVWMAAGLIVGGVAFVEWRRGETAKTVNAHIEAFEAARLAFDEGRFADAEAGFEALTDKDTALSALAGHYLAEARLTASGDKTLAGEALDAIAAGDGNAMERLAVLKAAYLKADTLSVDELEEFLGPLTQEPSALGALALELLAARAYESGDFQRARREFGFLAVSLDAPSGVTRRAQAALAILPAPVDEAGRGSYSADGDEPVVSVDTDSDIDSGSDGDAITEGDVE